MGFLSSCAGWQPGLAALGDELSCRGTLALQDRVQEGQFCLTVDEQGAPPVQISHMLVSIINRRLILVQIAILVNRKL